MNLYDDRNGFTLSLNYDMDGFPIVCIDTGGGFYSALSRPAVLVILNDRTIHEMFDEKDRRWLEPPSQ